MARQQIVLRVEPSVKKHVRAQAKAAGLSLNAYCEKKLGAGRSASGSKGSK
jgi:predicted HicB family RNase H-like nuclease